MPQPTPQRPGGPSGCRRPAAPGAGVEVVVKAFDDVSFFYIICVCLCLDTLISINTPISHLFLIVLSLSFFRPLACP